MSAVLVCIPADRHDPQALFSEALDYEADAAEAAEYAALVLASVWALSRYGERFVVTAEVDPEQVGVGEESANGGVTVTGLRRNQLVAWFGDHTPTVGAVAAAAVQGQDIDDAWQHDAVTALLEHELLWHTIEEWGI